MRYQLLDGKIIEATNSIEFVNELRNISFNPSTDVKKFMSECSQRAKLFGKIVRFYNEDVFLEDMLGAGFVDIINLHDYN